MKFISFIFFTLTLSAQVQYNHPEIDWRTFETENFRIHYYADTELSARKGAFIAESIFEPIVKMYQYRPNDKTDIIFRDTDDISNGAAYFYDNKIVIWTSPLDFELRGSHRWLQNVITHEFAHIKLVIVGPVDFKFLGRKQPATTRTCVLNRFPSCRVTDVPLVPTKST